MIAEQILGVEPLTRDPMDERDHIRKIADGGKEGTSSSLGEFLLPAHEQQYSSCAAFALMQFVHILTARLGFHPYKLSPFDLYWQIREHMGTLPYDSGCNARAAMKTLHKIGGLPWHLFPGNREPGDDPGNQVMRRFRINGYERIEVGPDTPRHVRRIISEDRLPIFAGFNIPLRYLKDPDFDKHGDFMEKPEGHLRSYGHAVCLYGYIGDEFNFVNSWGTKWGQDGKGILHAEWLQDPYYCLDLWTLPAKHP